MSWKAVLEDAIKTQLKLGDIDVLYVFVIKQKKFGAKKECIGYENVHKEQFYAGQKKMQEVLPENLESSETFVEFVNQHDDVEIMANWLIENFLQKSYVLKTSQKQDILNSFTTTKLFSATPSVAKKRRLTSAPRKQTEPVIQTPMEVLAYVLVNSSTPVQDIEAIVKEWQMTDNWSGAHMEAVCLLYGAGLAAISQFPKYKEDTGLDDSIPSPATSVVLVEPTVSTPVKLGRKKGRNAS